MKKITALLVVLGGSVALATANAAPASHAHLNVPVLKVADQSNNANSSSQAADQDLAQATQDQTDGAATTTDQADNSDFDNNDDSNGDDN